MLKEAAVRVIAEQFHRRVLYPLLTSGQAKKDREVAHERILGLMEKYIENNQPLRKFLTQCFTYEDPVLEQEIFGLKFKQPCMVAAGFDKNARVYQSLTSLGLPPDIGTIPRWPYAGTPKPRVFMLEGDQGMINRMGYPSDGLHEIEKRLAKKYTPRNLRDFNIHLNFGVNQPSFDRGAPLFDLALTYNDIYGLGDILTLAVSPNTPDSLGLLEPENLSEALERISNIRKSKKEWKPLLLKLIPDLTFAQIDKILDVALSHGVDGMVLTNTTTDPNTRMLLKGMYKDETGGYSGPYLKSKSLVAIHYVYTHTEGKFPICAAGGLNTPLDAFEAVVYGGASWLQFYYAVVTRKTSTPNFSYDMCQSLAKELRTHGFKNITEAVGAYAK
ncbi:dihydroorotate dehydrogenase (quinone) [Candidatus Daviesbacteria bacterium]|nr:dihydroorotate dehydrogenase (quinone) [Candidatus Daviesbacteria bacterium]